MIEKSFYEKTYKQNRLLGPCLLERQLFFDGTCIVSHATKEIMDEFNADASDLDGIINKLRITKGVKVAALHHQVGNEEYKVSLRANDNVDVSKIACYFGGGGHVKAAGCTLHGEFQEQFDHLLDKIKEQMMES